MSDHPIIKAADDNGYGYHVFIYGEDGCTTLLEAVGVSITTGNRGFGLRLTLRSEKRDFEHDSLYLLDADFSGDVEFFGHGIELTGVLSKFKWRTEETVAEELKDCPSGDGVYMPKGDIGNDSTAAWQGKPYEMVKVRIRAYPRGPETEEA